MNAYPFGKKFKYLAIYILLTLPLINGFTQEPTVLNLPNELYFYYFSGGSDNKIFYIQEDDVPIEVFSHQGSIRGYLWSHDGEKIAINTAERGTGRSFIEVHTYAHDFQLIGRFEVDLHENYSLQFPMMWSEDSQNLFLISSSANLHEIISLSLDSSDNRALIEFPIHESEELAEVYWSPDAKYLLYQTIAAEATPMPVDPTNNIPQPEVYKLYLFNLESNEASLVTEHSYRYCVAWSRDGELFSTASTYARDTEYPWMLRASEMQIYNLALESVSEISLRTELENSLACPMAWSNDGQKIASSFHLVIGEDYPEYRAGIAIIDVNSDEFYVLGHSNSQSYGILSMLWSPDDSWIAIDTLYNAYNDVRLFSIETGEEIVINLEGWSFSNPSWRVNE